MDFTKNHLKIWVKSALCLQLLWGMALPSHALAAFASQFSFGASEQFSDNIFFQKKKESDFVTSFTPTLSFFYAPSGAVVPTGSLGISAIGEIFNRHSSLSNFGENILADATYGYSYSPRLSFSFADGFRRQGPTRTGSMGEPIQLQTGSTTTTAPGIAGVGNLRDFVSRGDQISNAFSARGTFLYQPDISFTGHYNNAFVNYLGQGGSETAHDVGFRGVYNWRRDHNLHAGYSVLIDNSRNGQQALVHNFDIGDDYFSNYTLQLTPTLSLTGSTGLSFNFGSDGPRVANNTNITVVKLWETAVLNAGLRKGLTPSFGVAGVSDTLSIFTNFQMRFTERLSTQLIFDYSRYDTEDTKFNTLRAGVALQYLLANWLTSELSYRFNQLTGVSGTNRTDLIGHGTVSSNIVFLNLTARFDLWPNVGLARGISPTSSAPTLRTPFSISSPISTKTP